MTNFTKIFVKLICLSLFVTISNGTDENKERKKFIPTSEWQIVEPGQHLPPGLHIRHNFESKVTEAKLLDENEKSHAISVVDVQEAKTNNDFENIEEFSIDKSEDSDLKTREENIAKKYRSYKELKEDLSALNLTMKLDMEVMNELFERFNKIISSPDSNFDELTNILTDFEFFVHQFDNAKYFIQKNGIKRIIFPTLELENVSLNILGLHILSAAVQNNPKVQIALYEENIIPILVELILTQNKSLINPTLGTLSKLLRRFPTAQWAFIKNKGFESIYNLIQNDEIFIDNGFKFKVLTFLIDFVTDSKELLVDFQGRKNIHAEFVVDHLITNFKSDGWCTSIKKFIDNVNLENYDIVEQIFILIHTTKDKCWHSYNEPDFKDKVDTILKYYENLARNEISNELDSSEYLIHFVNTIRNLTSIIYEKANFISKDEL